MHQSTRALRARLANRFALRQRFMHGVGHEMKYGKIVLGAILSPFATAVLASLLTIGTGAFLQTLLFSFIILLATFLALGGISHVILRWKQWKELRQYLGVMFVVATFVLFCLRVGALLWIFGNGGSEFHFATQVIDNGGFTLGGVILTLIESMFGSLWLCISFALFWYIAVRNSDLNGSMPNKPLKNDARKNARAS